MSASVKRPVGDGGVSIIVYIIDPLGLDGRNKS
jgi:hypothetical protein